MTSKAPANHAMQPRSPAAQEGDADPAVLPPAQHRGLSGWIEGGLYVVTLSVLNLTYVVGHAVGAHPVTFIAVAMLVAAISLLVITGPGPDWRAIALTPQSWIIGSCIIAMEAIYYILLTYVSPADGSMLVRLTVPMALIMGAVLLGRHPPRSTVAGAILVVVGIGWCALELPPDTRGIGVALGICCALIMNARSFSAEFHPWNRAAKTIIEKMRITGIVLLVTCLAGLVVLAALLALVAHGILPPTPALPRYQNFLHVPTLLVALFVGTLVLTTMQYLAFSTVVKIRTENFMAVNAFTPAVTLIFQMIAVAAGVIAPIPFDWHILPPMAVVIAGVLTVIASARRSVG